MYSDLPNKYDGWNKHDGWKFLKNLIDVMVRISVMVGKSRKNLLLEIYTCVYDQLL